MGQLYVKSTGAAGNSGSTDTDAATLTGTAATVSGSVVTLDGSPNLSGLVTSGPNQSSIYIADATNTNKKIFWITAFDDTANTVTVDTAPTGVTSSVWAIGGRQTVIDTALSVCRAGDTCWVHPGTYTIAGTVATFRLNGDSTSGPVKLRGVVGGARPVLNTTTTANCVSSAVNYSWIEYIEIDQDGATGSGIVSSGPGMVVHDCKITDAGQIGISATQNLRATKNDIAGTGGQAISCSSSGPYIKNNYIHGGTIGIEYGGTSNAIILDNLIAGVSAQGITLSSGSVTGATAIISGNTIASCGNSGLEVTDADWSLDITNNIFYENGNAAGEFNVEVAAGAGLLAFTANNIYFHSGGGGGANLSNLTAGATDLTSDPLFTNPGAGDYTLQSGSPAKAAGTPGAMGSLTGYRDIGALQRQEPAGGTSAHVVGC